MSKPQSVKPPLGLLVKLQYVLKSRAQKNRYPISKVWWNDAIYNATAISIFGLFHRNIQIHKTGY